MDGARRGWLIGLLTAFCAITAGGCGGDDEATGEQFVGTWQFSSGTVNTACPMLAVNDTSQLTGDMVSVAKGVTSPLVYAETDPSCTWKMTVAGSVASISAGQSCMFTDKDSGVVFTGTYTAATFTVTGTTGQFSGTLTAMANVNGSIVNCSATGNGGLTKISN